MIYTYNHDNRSAVVSFQAVAYEYAVEMTYPVPEIMSAGLLNGLAQVAKLRKNFQLLFVFVFNLIFLCHMTILLTFGRYNIKINDCTM